MKCHVMAKTENGNETGNDPFLNGEALRAQINGSMLGDYFNKGRRGEQSVLKMKNINLFRVARRSLNNTLGVVQIIFVRLYNYATILYPVVLKHLNDMREEICNMKHN